MTQRWGNADVRLFLAASDSDLPLYVGAYAEVHRGCHLEMFRSTGDGTWWRVEETEDDLRAKDFTLVFEEQPEAFEQVDPSAVPTLRHLLEQVELARRIATRAHAGQTDRAGLPYIDHPRRVAARVSDLQEQAVAWLHDVIEDTALTVARLRDEGIDDEVVRVVELLTRDVGDDVYYARIAAVPVAREVKLADIADNTDPERTALLDPDTRDRLAEKYTHAQRALGAEEAHE